jgi:hypothetical protein
MEASFPLSQNGVRQKLRISETVIGGIQLSTSFILRGSTETPPAEITCPRKATSVNQNSHLLNLAYTWLDLSFSNTNLRCSSCSSIISENIRMLSINTTTNLSRYSTNKCGFRDIFLPDFQLMVSRSQIDLREYACSILLVKQIFNPWKGIFILNGDLIQ